MEDKTVQMAIRLTIQERELIKEQAEQAIHRGKGHCLRQSAKRQGHIVLEDVQRESKKIGKGERR